MKNLLTGALIGAVVAVVVGGTVWSATSLMYLTGTVTAGHTLVAADTTGGVSDSGGTADRLLTLTWWPGQNLTTNTLPMGVVGGGSTATVISSGCAIGSALVGGTATLDLWYAPSGTALGTTSGTAAAKINTTTCTAGTGGTVNGYTGMGGTASIPASSVIGVVATGAGWTGSSAGSGAVQVRIQQQ
jgi:hypothetical protein